MRPHHVFSAVLGLSMLSGIFSPFVFLVAALAPLWLPTWVPTTPQMVFYFSSLITATGTMLIAGVPAALVEGAFPKTRGTLTPMYVWVAAALFVASPAMARMLVLSMGG